MNVPTDAVKGRAEQARDTEEFESVGPLHFKRREPREPPVQGEKKRRRNYHLKTIAGLVILFLIGAFVFYPPFFSYFPSPIGSDVSSLRNSAGSGIQNLVASVQKSLSSSSGPVVNSTWVADFIAQVNSHRGVPLTLSAQLDQYAKLRFNDMVAHYQITHYNSQNDFDSFFAGQSISGEEEYFYPSGYTPASFVTHIQQTAPAHWQGLIDSTYVHYGFYVGSGPVYEVNAGCSATEIVGSVNQTQFFQEHGCTFTIRSAVWFVIELSS